MGLDNPIHIAFLVVILLLVFGAKRLPEIGRSLGSGMREFKDSITNSSGNAPQQPTLAQPVQPPLCHVARPLPSPHHQRYRDRPMTDAPADTTRSDTAATLGSVTGSGSDRGTPDVVVGPHAAVHPYLHVIVVAVIAAVLVLAWLMVYTAGITFLWDPTLHALVLTQIIDNRNRGHLSFSFAVAPNRTMSL